jgi:Zn-dependent peptidase ImmA (M78 family)
MEQDFSDFRPTRVWKRLSADRRLVVAEPFWNDDQSTEQQAEAIAAIALRMKFRTKSVLGLPLAKRVKYLTTLPNISDAIVARVMVAYHLERQRPMMSAFLDSLGIAHENGLIAEETLPKQDTAKLHAAATELATKFLEDDVTLYFATLVAQDPETWGELAEHCQSLVGTS